jgi:hypothetical protein
MNAAFRPAHQPRRMSSLDALALLALAVPWIAAAVLPALPQWQSYHDFADQRLLFGVPHALNVLSNLPFLAIGALGLVWTGRHRERRPAALPYTLFFVGATLTAFGSGWYHADPRDATLVWDRLPMALAFAGLLAGTLADRAPSRATPYAVGCAAVGVGTVLAWHWSGDLVAYLAMQAGFVATALYATARVPSPFTRARWLYGATALYGVALVCERFDGAIDGALGGTLSGHTLKHLFAAAALAVILVMVRSRRPIDSA